MIYSSDLTSVPLEFFKHAIPDYLVVSTDLFSLRMSNLKNDNNQHNNIHLVWINKNYTYFLSEKYGKKYDFGGCASVISLCVLRHEEGWKSLIYKKNSRIRGSLELRPSEARRSGLCTPYKSFVDTGSP